MTKIKIINKVISEEVNQKILEIGTITASNWGGVCISYEFDYKKQEIFFLCNEHGEEFYTSISFEELKNDYNIEVVENSSEKIDLKVLSHKNIFETVIDTINQECKMPDDIDYCLVSDEYFINTKMKTSYFNEEYRDLIFKLNYGSNEGIYLDVYVYDIYKLRKLATIKSLNETNDGIYKMAQLQADIIIGYNKILKEIRRM